jgi:hypothetical protein
MLTLILDAGIVLTEFQQRQNENIYTFIQLEGVTERVEGISKLPPRPHNKCAAAKLQKVQKVLLLATIFKLR